MRRRRIADASSVGLESFNAQARQRSEDLRRATRVSVADPYASSYPLAWGAEVIAIAESGASFKVSRRDCKGDPELALDNAEMRHKALGLLNYGGLDEMTANQLCDAVLSMPEKKEADPIFSRFIAHVLD